MWTRGKKKIYWERFKYPDGHSEVKSLGTADHDLAKAICEKRRTDILMDKDFGTKRTRKKMKVVEILDDYMKWAEINLAPDTCTTYTSYDKFWRKRLDIYAEALTTKMLKEIYRKTCEKNKASTAYGKFAYLKTVFTRAVTDEKIDKNPLLEFDVGLGKGTIPKGEVDRVRYLKGWEEKKLFDALNLPKYHWLRDYVIVAKETGLRRKNMCQMTWDHVDFDSGVLSFQKHEMKGRKAFIAYMSKNVFQILSRRFNERHLANDKNHVFTYGNGFKVNKGSLTNTFVRFVRNVAGLKDFRLHDLRHDFCSKLVQGNVDLYVVSKMASHSSIKQTEKYANLAPKQKRNALLVFDNKKHFDDVIDVGENSATVPLLPQANQRSV